MSHTCACIPVIQSLITFRAFALRHRCELQIDLCARFVSMTCTIVRGAIYRKQCIKIIGSGNKLLSVLSLCLCQANFKILFIKK